MNWIWIFSSVLFASSPPPIHVQPEFRQTPIWYWQSPENKCVPVPSYDVISRVAPARIRQKHFKTPPKACELKVDSRQIQAELNCDGQLLTRYFSQEQMCKDHLGVREASCSWRQALAAHF